MNDQGITKRYSFPLRTYSWHGVRRNHITIENGDDPLNPYKVRNAPVVTSEGTLKERETRLEEALLWIRKELVSYYKKMSFKWEKILGKTHALL